MFAFIETFAVLEVPGNALERDICPHYKGPRAAQRNPLFIEHKACQPTCMREPPKLFINYNGLGSFERRREFNEGYTLRHYDAPITDKSWII
jgi:hypothetical protein